LALLTHQHLLWLAALILAYIDFPDFLTPFNRIAKATEIIAGQEATDEAVAERQEASPPKVAPAEQQPKGKKGAVHA